MGQLGRAIVSPPSRITIKSLKLLFGRLSNEQLVQSLEEQSVWALLQGSSTFLQGVGLLARWAPGLPGPGSGACRAVVFLLEGLGHG